MRKAIEGALLSGMVALLAGGIRIEPFSWSAPKPKLSESHSSPIAITSDDRFVWVVNPDNDSVSIMEVVGDVLRHIRHAALVYPLKPPRDDGLWVLRG